MGRLVLGGVIRSADGRWRMRAVVRLEDGRKCITEATCKSARAAWTQLDELRLLQEECSANRWREPREVAL